MQALYVLADITHAIHKPDTALFITASDMSGGRRKHERMRYT